MRIIVVHGFLGSGKTSFIRSLLKKYKTARIGLLINEYGTINIDAQLIKEQAIIKSEISQGSIFCSCKSNEFVEWMIKLVQMPLDYIIVEASGLANPNSLDRLMDFVAKTVDKSLDYYNITMIDAKQFMKLKDVLMMINKQLAIADILLINKLDLVGEQQVTELINYLSVFEKPLMMAKYGIVDLDIDIINHSPKNSQQGINYQQLDLMTMELNVSGVDKLTMERYLQEISSEVLRVKGINRLTDGDYILQVASGVVEIVPTTGGNHQLIILYTTKQTTKVKLLQKFGEITNEGKNENSLFDASKE